MANKIKMQPESPVTWRGTGGGGTYTWVCTSLASGAARQGPVHNYTDPRARRVRVRAFCKPTTTSVIGEPIHIYIKRGDGTHYDNDDGVTDLTVSSLDKLRNCLYVGTMVVDETNAAVEISKEWDIEITADRIMPIMHNGTANALSATVTDFGVDVTELPDEIQAAA